MYCNFTFIDIYCFVLGYLEINCAKNTYQGYVALL